MPELPEVENVVRDLRRSLSGRQVLAVDECFPGVYQVARGLDGPWPRAVTGVRRRAKLILIDLEGDLVLTVHLRMTGHLSVDPASGERRPHTHVRICLDDDLELRFSDPRRFGGVRLETGQSLASSKFFSALGPEPLEMTEQDLFDRLSGTRAGLKAALLDQRRVAGIGNIYADEILFDCGLHPGQPANTILPREWGPLLSSVQRILMSAIEHGGSTIRDYRSADGDAGSFQDEHRVFGRADQPCPECGSRIRKIRIAGRGTHFCPSCQRLRRRRPRRPDPRVRTPR